MAKTTTTTGKPKGTTDHSGQPLYLRLIEDQTDRDYYHLTARVCVQKYEDHAYVPYGCDDDYSDGLLWSGLRISCQGDARSRQRAEGQGESGPVYGFGVSYADQYHTLDLRRVRRMAKTLERIERGLGLLQERRGYVHTYGEYVGRVAEVLGCAGLVVERSARSREVSGLRYDWLGTGDGINAVNRLIWAWVEAGKPQAATETTDAGDEARAEAGR